MGEAFDLSGTYRVQSRRIGHPSRLAGRWAILPAVDPDMAFTNDMLRADPQWRGQSMVDIRPAFVERREGEFAEEPDILYKRSHFEPGGAAVMPSDIVDVLKAAERWSARRGYVRKLFGGDVAAELASRIGSIERIAALEYFMHEAGHCLGYDTATKYRDGYFQIHGKTVWPLVYVEELRADLLSFGFAARYLPRDLATAIFFYNLLLRFGSHLEDVDRRGCYPYGAIPFMLWGLLYRAGFIRPVAGTATDRVWVISSLDPATVICHMKALGDLARERLVELDSLEATDSAITAANFYRSVLEDDTVRSFDVAIAQARAAAPSDA